MDKMRRNKINKAYAVLNIILPIVSLVAIAAIYAIISKAVDIELIVPSVGATAKSFFELLGKGYFIRFCAPHWHIFLPLQLLRALLH